jgi:hypothetical protein
MESIDYFIHAANILMVAAYTIRDILWLRLFAVVSSLAAMPYFLLQPTPSRGSVRLECPLYWGATDVMISLSTDAFEP